MTNYQKGVKLERKLVNKARSEGKIAFRSAGSHSPIDVVIIDTENRVIQLIQCKKGALSSKDRKEVVDRFAGLSDEFMVIGSLVHEE